MTVLATKLYAPPARLLDRLNEGLHGCLTLVSAPAGFGKTTLVSTWLAESDRPAANGLLLEKRGVIGRREIQNTWNA